MRRQFTDDAGGKDAKIIEKSTPKIQKESWMFISVICMTNLLQSIQKIVCRLHLFAECVHLIIFWSTLPSEQPVYAPVIRIRL